MRSQQHANRKQAMRMIGCPVCVELMDGSYYIGTITYSNEKELVLNGLKGKGQLNRYRSSSSKRKKQAMISSLFPSLFSMLGGGGPNTIGGSSLANLSPFGSGAAGAGAPSAAATDGSGVMGGLGGLGGMFGMIRRSWPMIRMGYSVVRQIMPLLGGLR